MKFLGVRVLRGPDWSRKDADGGEGHLGTVVGVKDKVGTAEVVWDNGQVTTCRIGKEGKHELKIYDSAPAGECVSRGVVCQGCRNSSIYGTSWRCSTCSNLHLCSRCYHLGVHPLSHHFLRLDNSTQQGVAVGTRSGASRIPVFGIFPEARVARGRHWEYGDAVGGPDGTGTVVELVSPEYGSARNAVRVSWDSGQSLQHRLGLHGKVDLVCTEEAPGPACYVSHLPVLTTRAHILATKLQEASRPKVPQATPLTTQTKKETEKDVEEEIRNIAEKDEVQDEGCVPIANEGHLGKVRTTKVDSGKVDCGTAATHPEVKPVEAGCPAEKEIGAEPAGSLAGSDATREDSGLTAVPKSGPDTEGEIGVGDRVEVGVDFDTFRDIQSQTASWTDNMAKCLGRSGVVRCVTATGQMEVDFEGDTWRISPICLIKETKSTSRKFKEGDTVRIISDVKLLEEQQEDHGGWNSDMMQAAGKVGKVQKVTSRGDLSVKLGQNCWVFNPLNCRPAPGCPMDFPQSEDTDGLLQALVSQGSSKVKAFIDAAREGNCRKLADMLEQDPGLVHQERHGATALHFASKEGRTEAVRLLVAMGADINSGLGHGDAPLMLALHYYKTETAGVLIELGADVNRTNLSRMTSMHVAVIAQNVDGVRLLLQHRASVNCQDSKSNTPLYIAITENVNVEITEALLGASDLDLRVRNKQLATPLHMAVYRNKFSIVERILARDPGVLNLGMSGGMTALKLAVQENYLDMTRLLIRAGASVNVRDEKGQAPLHSACFADHIDCARLLVESGAEINGTSDKLETPLHFCLGPLARRSKVSNADKGLELGKYLIQHGARTDVVNREGLTPLELAKPSVRKALQQFLALADRTPQKNMNADERSDPRLATDEYKTNRVHETLSPSNATNDHQAAGRNSTPASPKNTEHNASRETLTNDMEETTVLELFQAVHTGSIDKVKAMLDIHPHLVRGTHGGETALHYAAMLGNTEVVRLLVASGADINKGDNDADPPLVRSIMEKQTEAARVLVELGADVNYISAGAMTPLHVAIAADSVDGVRLLLEHRADVNIRNSEGKSALVFALCVQHGDPTVVEALLEARDLDVRVTTNQEANALHMAVHTGNTRAVEKILARDPALVNVTMERLKSPLHIAASGATPVLKMLLRAGANVNARDQTRRTPLHLACPGDHRENARILVENGADLNAANEDGNTPLHFCIAFYREMDDRYREDKGLELAKYLIQQGARADLYNNRGQTILDAARPVVREGVKRFLKDRVSQASPKPGNPNEMNKAPTPVQSAPASVKCVTCQQRDTDVVFLPCAHKLLCRQCAGSARSCRECGSVIEGKIDTEGNPVEQKLESSNTPAMEEPENMQRQDCKVQ